MDLRLTAVRTGDEMTADLVVECSAVPEPAIELMVLAAAQLIMDHQIRLGFTAGLGK